VRLAGRLDILGIEPIALMFISLTASHGQQVLVDLREASFLATIGIRSIVSSARALEAKGGKMALLPGDLLLLHTDGITEAENARGLPFGAEGCAQLLESVGGGEAPLPLVLQELLASLERFVNAEPLADDCTLMALRRLGG